MFIVKVPGINGENSEGCERAGNAILSFLREFQNNEQGNSIDVSSLDLEEIHLDNSDLKLTNKLIYENSLETFGTKPRTIFLGGDHSISYSILAAFHKFCELEKKKPCLIVFDAHADCLEETKYPTNRNWLRKLIVSGFPKENILLVGVRNINKKEMQFLKENKIKIVSISSLTEDLHETCDTIMEFSSGKELYVSVDIDVIDPVFAPSTSYPEIGGLTSRQFLYLIQRIKKIKTLRGIDLVEINEKKDKDKLTIKLGAKILAELL